MDTGQLDMLHDSGDEGVGTVADGVGLALQRMLQEAVDQDGAVGSDADGGLHILLDALLVIDDLHAAATQHIGGTNHDGVADLLSDLNGLLHGGCHTGLRHGDLQLVHHGAEQVSILGQVDHGGGSSQDLDAVLLQVGSQVQRGLAAELGDNAHGLLLLVDAQNVLQRQGLEVELVRGVVVGGDGGGVAVDDDGLEAQLLQSQRGVDGAVVELDALADPVGAAAQDHDLGLLALDGVLVLTVVGGEVVSVVLGAADVDTLPGLLHTQLDALVADIGLGHTQDLAQVLVREAVLLGGDQGLVRGQGTLAGTQGLFLLHQLLHLLDEPGLDLGDIVDLLHGSAGAQGLVHDEVALAGGGDQHVQQLVLGQAVENLHVAQTVASVLQGTDGLLEGLLIGLADGHDLTDGPHLGAKLVLNALELLEGEAGELDDDVIAVGLVLVQGAVLAAGDVLQSQAGGQHGGHQRDGETGSLGGQRGGTGGTGVDLNNDDAVGHGVVGKLHVGAADDLHGLDDLEGLLLQTALAVLRDGQHRSGAEGVTGVDTQRVDVLDEADGDHVVVGVANDLDLQLFPAQDGLLDQHLTHQRGGQTALTDDLQLFLVIDQTAAGAAHGVCRTQNDRIIQLLGDGQSLIHGVGHLAAGHLDAQLVHGLLELDAVLAALDGIDLHADDLHIVLVQHTGVVQLSAQVQTGLAAQVGQQGIGALLGNDLLQTLHIQRLNIGNISSLGVSHDGGGIGVDQHDLVTKLAQSLTGLRAGVVKLTGLTNDDGAGADDKNLVDISSLRHRDTLLYIFLILYYTSKCKKDKQFCRFDLNYFSQIVKKCIEIFCRNPVAFFVAFPI